MTTAIAPITAEQLWRMPRDEQRYELVRGELHTMAPSGFEHGSVIVRLTVLLAKHVQKRKLGVVVGAETGFVLTKEPDTVRAADIAFVRAARIPGGALPKKFWIGAPDLAVEVLSPADRPREVKRKVQDYIASSAAMVWVVNPKNRTVTVHRPMVEPRTLRSGDTLDGGEVVPWFKCKVSEIFE